MADLNIENYENELFHVINGIKLDFDGMLSSYFYTNTDDTQTNLILKLVASVTYYKNNAIPGQNIDLLIFTYTNNSCLTPLNNWDDINSFTILFSTFFYFGTSSNFALNKRSKKIKISLNI